MFFVFSFAYRAGGLIDITRSLGLCVPWGAGASCRLSGYVIINPHFQFPLNPKPQSIRVVLPQLLIVPPYMAKEPKSRPETPRSGFRVSGFRFEVEVFRVQGSRFRVQFCRFG